MNDCELWDVRDTRLDDFWFAAFIFFFFFFFARIFIIYQPFLTMMMVSFLSLYFFFSWSIFCTIITVGKSTRHIHLALASLGSAGYHELNKYLLMHAHAHTLEEGNIFIFRILSHFSWFIFSFLFHRQLKQYFLLNVWMDGFGWMCMCVCVFVCNTRFGMHYNVMWLLHGSCFLPLHRHSLLGQQRH